MGARLQSSSIPARRSSRGSRREGSLKMMTPNDKKKELKIRRAKTGDAARLADLSGQLGYPTTAAQMRERLRGIKPAFQHAGFVAESASDGVVALLHVTQAPLH